VNLLPDTLREVQEQLPKRLWMTGPAFWAALDYGGLRDLQTTFAPLMRYRPRRHAELIRLSLPDQIGSRRWIVFGPGGEGAFADSYRREVEAYVRGLADQLPPLRKLRQGEPLAETDLQALTDALNRADLFITEDTLRQAFGRPDADLTAFLRHILGLQVLPSREDQIAAAFEGFLAAHPHFTATQVLFLRTVRSAVLRGTRLTEHDLQRLPFSRVGPVARLFPPDQVTQIIEFANGLAV
jgi:type I restriction enzyme R subunit